VTFTMPPFWAQATGRGAAPHAVSQLVVAPTLDVFSIVDGKLLAGLDWTPGDARDALMTRWIAAAESKVETDTGLALLTQTRDVYLDAVSGRTIVLPSQSRPLQSVASIKSTDTAGVVNTLDPSNYVVDLASGRIGLSLAGAWPSDLRPFQPYVLRIVAGWTSVALLQAEAPLLVHAVGLLVAHYATVGRDATTVGTIITDTPYGYDDAIAGYVPVSLA
jgi:uncharacterized phiE125 gp8 family phage protein